jgi:prepilin peptidase CpaA
MSPLLATAAIGLFLAAAATDVARRRIPNPLVAALAVIGLLRLAFTVSAAPAFGAAAALAAADLGVAIAVFTVGAAIFHFNLLGGGDVKLLAAGALFLGAGGLWPFLVVTAAAGGVLALGYLAFAVIRSRAGAARPSLPYGVAIAAGGVFATLALA